MTQSKGAAPLWRPPPLAWRRAAVSCELEGHTASAAALYIRICKKIERHGSLWTVPRPADKKNKSLSQNIEGLHGFAPDFIGSKAVFQVNAPKIIEVDVLSNQFFNLSASRIPSTI